jgi:small-conductance mechanosensitive channel
MQSFLESSFYHNTVLQWIIAVGIALGFLLLVKLIQVIVLARLKKLTERTQTNIDDIILGTFSKTHTFLVILVGLAIAAFYLQLPPEVMSIVHVVVTVAVALQVALWLNAMIGAYLSYLHKKKKEEDPASVSIFGALSFFARVVLWSVILLIALDNLGIDITTLIAGLGIGGIAIALAAQNILSDIFNSVVILIDKPFEVGDFIIVGDMLGTVEKIGIKTTRVRSLFGEQLVFTNSDLIGSRIKNYKRMAERRITFQIGVIYQTTADQLEEIPGMIREIIQSIDKTRFDRSHFKGYGGSSLDFETVYYVLTGDYNIFMDIQQEINLKLFRRCEQEGIEFAYPTQTLFIESEVNTARVKTGEEGQQ